MSDETYLRVCVLKAGHEGGHLPYEDAPDKDDFANKHIAHPRCTFVSQARMWERRRFRVVFEIVSPLSPNLGWHEIVNEHSSEKEAVAQLRGLRELERKGEVRLSRLESATVQWVPIDV